MNSSARRLLGRAAIPFAFAAALGLAACNSTPKEEDIVIEGSVEDLYNRATDLLEAENYKEAARFYNEVDRQHPYSTWASRAQLMAAYSFYKEREYETALAALNRFIRLHPSHRDIAYAYYLKALCSFEQVRDVKRDQTPSEEALKSFDEVVKRFPDTRYAQDSRNKMILVQDHLAGAELDVGRWYQRHGRYLAAINRYKVVIDKYQTSRQVPEALHRMTESYTALGLTDEARRVASVLGANYPSSEWYFDSYELVEKRPVERPPSAAAAERKPFMRRAMDWLF